MKEPWFFVLTWLKNMLFFPPSRYSFPHVSSGFP